MKLTKQKLRQIIKEEKKLLTEKKELDQKIIDKVAKLTDSNHHEEARIVLAKDLKDKQLEKALNAVKDLRDFYGHFPDELKPTMRKLDARLRARLGGKYPYQFDLIWQSL